MKEGGKTSANVVAGMRESELSELRRERFKKNVTSSLSDALLSASSPCETRNRHRAVHRQETALILSASAAGR